jgi:hypothetical protein
MKAVGDPTEEGPSLQMAANRSDDEKAGSNSGPARARWRNRYEGSVIQDLVKGLGEVNFGDQIIVFGASFLLSVLPLILLLSAFANRRVEDNIVSRLGVNREGAHIIDSLFTNAKPAFTFGIVVSLGLSLAGTIAVA